MSRVWDGRDKLVATLSPVLLMAFMGAVVALVRTGSVQDGTTIGGLGPVELMSRAAGPAGALLSAGYLTWTLRALRAPRAPATAP
jgi:hypothetical protein